MSSVDVGDAVELTFTSVTGATVVVSWLDPDEASVYDNDPVTEYPASSGLFPRTFLPTSAGVWTAVFTASGAATQVERYYIRASDASGPLPLAVVGDVAAQLPGMTPAQEALTGALLRAASKMIRARVPAVDDLIAAGRLDPDLVALAAANMVLRVLRNPGGLRSETVGPFSRTYDTSSAAGLLALTDEDLLLLTPPPETTSAAVVAGTIRLKAGLAPRPAWRCDTGRFGWRDWSRW